MMRASFHFPLHRYLAAFTCQAVSKMNMTLKDIIPPPDLLTLLMVHPLRVQVMNKILFFPTHHLYDRLFICFYMRRREIVIVYNLSLSRPRLRNLVDTLWYFLSNEHWEWSCEIDCNCPFRSETLSKKNTNLHLGMFLFALSPTIYHAWRYC